VKEIRIHGRGGQGAVLAAKMLASAFLVEGKSVASFPMYGFERRGAPVVAFTRYDEKPIREKTQIYNPDCIMVIDPGLLTLPTLYTGLKPNSVFILNTAKKVYKQPNEALKIGGLVDATGIAVQEIGRDIPNTCLLGAFAAATGWLKLESLLACLPEYLSGDVLKKNLKSAERGYKEVEVIKW
jgi:2-oxoacid:acceptor oxidoreductase gamma subunit (pyruvate/2-ketoisovalerate family)